MKNSTKACFGGIFASSIIITITPSSKALPYCDFRHNSETIIGYYGKSGWGRVEDPLVRSTYLV
jgi:hypothetical protein